MVDTRKLSKIYSYHRSEVVKVLLNVLSLAVKSQSQTEANESLKNQNDSEGRNELLINRNLKSVRTPNYVTLNQCST